ncbi:MAG: hypothetical protein JNJ83_16340 [Verrucomicrobiaceae bacterium]|nr:hypothetical protein [Verrucomicrobiaceae bacterium]
MESDPLTLAGYDREVIDRVWGQALAVSGNDPAIWRKDERGAWIHRQEYRNRHSQFGWEIADHGTFVRRVGVGALRAMQWQNYVDWMIASRNGSITTADGLNNVRKLI